MIQIGEQASWPWFNSFRHDMKLVLPEVQASRIEKISHDMLPLYNLNIKIYAFASFLLNFNSYLGFH